MTTEADIRVNYAGETTTTARRKIRAKKTTPTLAEVERVRDPQREFERREALREDIRSAINRNCIENETDTPDLILADYLILCLYVFETTFKARRNAALPDKKGKR